MGLDVRKRMTGWILLGLICASLGMLPEPVRGADFGVGGQVVVLSQTLLQDERQQPGDKVWPGLVLEVQGVQGRNLWVSNGKPGWLDQRHVIPLDGNAIGQLTRLINANPREAALYAGRANVLSWLGSEEGAIKDYNRAIQMAPNNAEYYVQRGTSWAATEDYEKAFADFNKALQIDPRNDQAYFQRAQAKYRQFEGEQAIEDYDQAIRINPNKDYYYFCRGLVKSMYLEQHEQALPDLHQALQMNPRSYLFYWFRGYIWTMLELHDKALADYDQSLRFNPQFMDAVVDRAYALMELEKFDLVLQSCNQMLRTDPENFNAYEIRALTWLIQGDYTKSIADYKKSLELNPENEGAAYELAGALFAARDAASLEYAVKALELSQGNPDFLAFAVLVARQQGKPAQAERLLARRKEWELTAETSPVLGFLDRSTSAETFLQKSPERTDEQVLEHFQVGLQLLADQKPAAAKPHFEQVRLHASKTTIEYAVALAELKRLSGQTGQKP